MPVDPFLEPLLDTMPPLPDPIDDFDAWRGHAAEAAEALTAERAEPGPEVGSIEEVRLPVGEAIIDLRVYQPATQGPHPAHLFLHGGGWMGGSIHETCIDIICRERCVGADCVVVAVNYRKAPENPAPIPLDDCHAALTWLVDHATDLNLKPDLITIGGQSAGANLAAALALKVRDEASARIALQLLETPVLDLTLSQPSHSTLGTGYGLESADLKRLVAWYAGSDPEQVHHPYLSPLLASDLSGLPPAHVMVAEYDPLRDDGESYVRRLQEAGVLVTFSLQKGQIHISIGFTKVMAAARSWREETITVLRRAHERKPMVPTGSTRGGPSHYSA